MLAKILRLVPFVLFSTFLYFSSGCVSAKPIKDYTLAQIALDAARSVEAVRYAPGQWHNAEEAFRIGERSFQRRHYDVAKDAFIKARMYAERAENLARITRYKEGEAF